MQVINIGKMFVNFRLAYDYDTANWENRFVVGGALEILFCALLNSIGYKCRWIKEARYDIEINGIKFSMKSNFTGTGDIIVDWEEPTLFFISDVGICYADPEMGLETRHTHDALVINTRQIKELIKRNDIWLIPIEIPKKPKSSVKIKTASYDVAKAILEEINSKHLRQNLPEV
ncbi:MAG: hypothetical protein ABIL23_01700 [candidate division WOR-3 bacterium]